MAKVVRSVTAADVPTDIALEALMLEEDEPVATRGHLQVQFEEVLREHKAVPSLTHTSGTEEGRWGKEGDHTIEKPLRKSAPDPAVHPRTISGGRARSLEG